MTANGYKTPLWDDGIFLKLDCGSHKSVTILKSIELYTLVVNCMVCKLDLHKLFFSLSE